MDDLTSHDDRLPYCDCHACALFERNRLRAELDACETELRTVRTSQAESNAEIERLRAELAEKTTRLNRIAALLKDNEPGVVYYGLEDDVGPGDHGCCGLLSYKPHAPDCWFAECRALAAKEE